MIREIKGDIFNYITDNDYIAHCISGDFVLGAGIAKEIDKRYEVKKVLKSNPNFKKYQSGVGYVLVTDKVFNLVTKEKYWEKPNYCTLEKCLETLMQMCIGHHLRSIHMPRIGCGLDRLDWKIVYPMIARVFKDSGIDVNIYYL